MFVLGVFWSRAVVCLQRRFLFYALFMRHAAVFALLHWAQFEREILNVLVLGYYS